MFVPYFITHSFVSFLVLHLGVNILMVKRELAALLCLSSLCLENVIVL